MPLNTLLINSYQAVISFSPELNLFRGEFVNLNGGADFFSKDVDGLYREGKVSLAIFLEACKKNGVPARKKFSGNFSLRLDADTHEAAVIAAAAQGLSLNNWASNAIKHAVGHD